jgi:DNA end-binding protein Ku
MPARAIDTARISFGLVTIPVKIYSTNAPAEQIHFHMVHAECGQRVKQQYVCPEHGPVERADIVKGFELSKGHVVQFDKEELKALEAVASDDISLVEFVPASAVDPIFVDSTYYLGPDKGGDRSYRLFRDALEKTELVGIASYSARGKQYIVELRPFEDGLAMHQLRYPDEIKRWSEVPLGKLPKPTSAELGLATSIVEQLRHDTWNPSQYTDEVKGRVRKLIAKKAKGGTIDVPEIEETRAEPVDLMEALKASLEGRTAKAHKPTRGAAQAKRGHASARKTSARPHAARTRTTQRARARAHR